MKRKSILKLLILGSAVLTLGSVTVMAETESDYAGKGIFQYDKDGDKNPEVVINADKIDTELNGLETKYSGLSTQISNLNTSVNTTIDSKLTTVNNTINDIKTSITNQDNKIKALITYNSNNNTVTLTGY